MFDINSLLIEPIGHVWKIYLNRLMQSELYHIIVKSQYKLYSVQYLG